MSNDTRKRLIKLIVQGHTESPSNKLLITDICDRANITRQAFNRYYSDLKPYVKNDKPLSDLLSELDEQSDGEVLDNFHRKIDELQKEISRLNESHKREIKHLENRLTTTLMNDDITLFNSEELRIRLDKQSLHNNKLIKEITNLETELTITKSQAQTTPHKNLVADFKVIEEDLAPTFKKYTAKKDIDLFENEKDAAIEKVIQSVNKLCDNKTIVVVFIDRYFCSFEKFVNNYTFSSQSPHLFVRLPIHTRAELRIALNKFSNKATIKLYMPYADSDITLKAQRQFYFNKVPDIELESANKAYLPTMSDQLKLQSICSFLVSASD